MDFSQRKLPKEAAAQLRIRPVSGMKPFVLVFTPVYVHLKRNEKFIGVKGPLDFFTPEELEKLAPYESIFFTEFIDAADPFVEAARRTRSLLRMKEPPAPYELSDAILKIIGPLWSQPVDQESLAIEPFFVAAFVNQLCDPLPGEKLIAARDRDQVTFEQAIFRSSWAVFMALHLGYCEMGFLNQLRYRAFCWSLGEPVEGAGHGMGDFEQIAALSVAVLSDASAQLVSSDLFSERAERAAQKFGARLERVRRELIESGAPMPTIFGPRGFVDA